MQIRRKTTPGIDPDFISDDEDDMPDFLRKMDAVKTKNPDETLTNKRNHFRAPTLYLKK